jgi:hypothetical protein
MSRWINFENDVSINLDNVFSLSKDGRNINFTNLTGLIEVITLESENQAKLFYSSLIKNLNNYDKNKTIKTATNYTLDMM